MFFARTIVSALFVAAASVQAFNTRSNDGLYAREFEESHAVAARALSERGIRHLNVVRDLAYDGEVLVLSARDPASLGLRSDDVLSHLIVARGSSLSSRTPYECKSKADCDLKIAEAKRHMTEIKPKLDAARKKYNDAKKASDKAPADKALKTAKTKAHNELHTIQESYSGWQERVEEYEDLKAKFATR
jgi:hypothetical protein